MSSAVASNGMVASFALFCIGGFIAFAAGFASANDDRKLCAQLAALAVVFTLPFVLRLWAIAIAG